MAKNNNDKSKNKKKAKKDMSNMEIGQEVEAKKEDKSENTNITRNKR